MNLLSFALGYALASSDNAPQQPSKPVPMTEAEWIVFGVVMAAMAVLAVWGYRKMLRMMMRGFW